MYKSFMEMPIWKESLLLSENIFKLTLNLPKSEDYGLTSQIRRSANSISANIAEAFGKSTPKDKNRFYTIARGSAFETQSHLLYGQKIKYFKENEISDLLKQYDQLIFDLNKIMKSLSQSIPQS